MTAFLLNDFDSSNPYADTSIYTADGNLKSDNPNLKSTLLTESLEFSISYNENLEHQEIKRSPFLYPFNFNIEPMAVIDLIVDVMFVIDIIINIVLIFQ